MMQHCILVKFTEGTEIAALIAPIQRIFDQTLIIPGIHAVHIRRSCIDRPNRYDLMIVLVMDKDALPAYDASVAHHQWKAEYENRNTKKAIFDWEDETSLTSGQL